MDIAHSLGLILRQRRYSLALNQVDVAAAANVDRGFISQVENGKRNISIPTFLRICEGLEADPCAVLSEALKRTGVS